MDITIPVLILAIPLFMFLLLGLAGVKMSHKLAGILGTLGMGTVLVLSYFTAFTYWFSGSPDFIAGTDRLQFTVFNQTWLQFTPDVFNEAGELVKNGLAIKLGFLLDPISALMLIVIPTISFMVHLYSLGYMKGEKGFQRYYAFLSLFSFSMLGLVVATNIFQMYIFWELVGASSFLLIGFFYTLPSAVAACKKAFIVTRFADLGFLIGILVLSFYTNQLDFLPMTQNPSQVLADFGGATSWVHRCSPGPSCSSSPAVWVNRPCSPSTSGSPTLWKAPPPCRPSSTQPPWLWPVYISWHVSSPSICSRTPR